MKHLINVVLFTMLLNMAGGQPLIDSLERELFLSKPDTNRVTILSELALRYAQSNSELAMKYAQQGLALARALRFQKGEADCLRRSGIILYGKGRYPEALGVFQQSLRISEDINYMFAIGAACGHIATLNLEQGDYRRARLYLSRYLKVTETEHNNFERANALRGIGEWYMEQNYPDSALWAYRQVFTLIDSSNSKFFVMAAFVLRDLGDLEAKRGNQQQAMLFFRKSIHYAAADNFFPILSTAYSGIAKLLLQKGERDSCIFYAQLALQAARKNNYAKGIMNASQLLSQLYESTDEHVALQYQKIATAFKDSLFNTQKASEVQNLLFDESKRQQSLENARINYRNQLRLYAVLSALGVFLLLAVVLYRNNIKTRRANALLKTQKEEIQQQSAKAENALAVLKSTQTQLIQQEKMASLGELTAGIAHEIQNPLNFVNNFSEVNKELLTEMNDELDKGNMYEARAISKEVIDNEEKILHHGKRADAIVKGMLQHSRVSTGQKEPTDINALADEYLRLSYHGMRAKDRSFNVTIKTDFDASIGKINIVPQDVGRVLLNLFNNAFYAVMQKKNTPGLNHYEPTVSISTKKITSSSGAENIEIRVKDNGTGIPQKAIDKVFQPFFTTKPAGQGTGLGLSLSYDIIKAHGGEIKVETKEGEGSEFIIKLPII